MMFSAAYASEAAQAAAAHGPFYASAEFWVSVAFVVVVGLAARPVFRAIAAGLDARGAKIKSQLEEVRKLREDAQALLAEYQRKQRDALQEAEGIIAHAKAEAERLRGEAKADLEHQVARRQQQALDRIAQAEAQAISEVRVMAINVAMSAAGSLIAEKLPASRADGLIDEAIGDLAGKLH